jgi:OTT_1508-like deaminase
MSFLISANRLFIQTQSHRLRKLFEGKFSVKVLNSLPPTTPYCCDLSSEAVQEALVIALARSRYLSEAWDEARKSFIETIADSSMVVRENTTVHAELAMIKTMVADGKMKDVLSYIGVSKLSCIMCSHYIRAFNEVMNENIVIKGSLEKTSHGWFWPGLPDHDEEIRAAFLRRIRQQIFDDFEKHERTRHLSDSSVGSGAPKWDLNGTLVEIDELIDMAVRGL